MNPESRKHPWATTVIWISIIGLALVPVLRARFGLFDSTTGVKSLVGLLQTAFVISVALRLRGNCGLAYRRFPLESLLAVAWVVWASTAVLASDHLAVAAVRHAEWITHALFAFAVFTLVRAEPAWRAAVAAIVAAGFVLYFIEFTVYRVLVPWTPESALPIPGYSNVRHLGYHAMLVVPLSMYLLSVTPAHRPTRMLLAPVALTAAWCMLFWAGGRGPLLALAAGFAVLPIFAGWKSANRQLLWVPGGALAGFVMSIPFSMPGFGFGRIADRLQVSTLAELSPGRLSMWEHVGGLVRQHSWLGLGPDGYLYHPHPGISWTVQPHNFPLQAAVDWGIPGALMVLGLIGLLLYRARHSLLTLPQNQRFPIAMLLWAGLAGLALACIDGPLYHAQPSMLLAVVFGLLMAHLHCPSGDNGRYRGAIAISLVCFSVFVIHTLSTAQAIRPGEMQVTRVFPSGLTDYRAPLAVGTRLLACIREGAATSCASDFAFVAGHIRPPHDAEFRTVQGLLETGNTDEAVRLLTRDRPWLRDRLEPGTGDR